MFRVLKQRRKHLELLILPPGGPIRSLLISDRDILLSCLRFYTLHGGWGHGFPRFIHPGEAVPGDNLRAYGSPVKHPPGEAAPGGLTEGVWLSGL